MSSSDSKTSIQFGSSVEYLNQFKKLILPDGTDTGYDPIRIELKKIIISKYKIFNNNNQPDKIFEFDLSGSLTAIVGQNCSGKTALLDAVWFFCIAVKHGSGCYSIEEATQIYGVSQEFSVLIKGIFNVHYQNTNDIRKLELEVLLVPGFFDCNGREMYTKSSSTNDLLCSKLELKERLVHVYVTIPNGIMRYVLCTKTSEFCPKTDNNVLLYRADYGELERLFPQVVIFNSKNVSNSNLCDLCEQNPEIIEHNQEIDNEIRRIFPFVRIGSFGSTTVDVRNGEISPTTPSLLMIDRHRRCYVFNRHDCGSKYQDMDPPSEGLLQCLVLIVRICCAKPNSIIIIDEPDAHVFPTAQKSLIEFFYRKIESFRQSNSFCQMLITTHSPEIMQTVKLEDIRQIFVKPDSHEPTEIKSLACIGQLYNLLTEIGASFLSHGELVRLGVHRKLLYLEGDDDFNFLHGLINRIKPELLSFPFTRVARGGRAKPLEIKEVIEEFRKFLPKENTLHVFILVDADLLSKSVLKTEKDDYDKIENDKNLNVKIYYHCWAVREWENWLLSNENLLYEMLCDDQLYHKEPMIKRLRDQIQQQRQSEKFFHNPYTSEQDQLTTATTASILPYFVDKPLFYDWFIKELIRYFEKLYEQLTLSQMGGNEINEQNSKVKDLANCNEYLEKNHIPVETMEMFGDLKDAIRVYIGQLYQQQRIPKIKRPRNDPNKIQDNLKECRDRWLSERQLQQPIDVDQIESSEELAKWLDQIESRKELTKWIDAKLFFHQLTNGKDNESKKRDLDTFWKKAFSQKIPVENHLYDRYFNSLEPQQYPKDFLDLVEKFEKFITAK